MFNSGVFLEGSLVEDQSFYFGYRKSTVSFFAPFLVDEDAEAVDGFKVSKFPDANDLYLKYHWDINESNNLNVFFTGAADSVAITIEEDAEIVQSDPALAGDIATDFRFGTLGGTLQHSLANGDEMSVTLGAMLAEQNSTLGIDNTSTIPTQTYISRLDYDHFGFKNRTVSAGLEVSRQAAQYEIDILYQPCTSLDPSCSDFTSGQRVTAKENEDITFIDGYLQDEWYLTNTITTTAGLHVSYDDLLDETIIQPRLRAQYTSYDELILAASVGRHHQFPGFPDVLEEFGNPNLNNITAMHYVLGVEKALYSGWNVKAETYYKSLDNFPVTTLDESTFSSDASGEAYGVELLIEKEQIDKLSGWLAVSLSKSERTNELTGKTTTFELDKPVVIDLVSNYQLTNHLNIGARWNLQSGTLYTPITGGEERVGYPGYYVPIYGELNSKRTPLSHRLDLRFEYTREFSRSNVMLYIDLINAYNQTNVSGYNYNTDFSEVTEESSGLPRLPLLGMKFTF
jgi:hypothetical protein